MIFPDNLFVLTRRQEVGAAPISATGQPAVSMTDDGPVSAVHVAWDVTTSRRQIIDDASSVVIASDESRGIRNRLALEIVNERSQPFRIGAD